MAGMRSPNYFGSFYDADEDSPFQRQVLGAQQGLTGQRGQVASFSAAQQAQEQQMESFRNQATQQLGQQQGALQQAAQFAQTAAERERAAALQERRDALSFAQQQQVSQEQAAQFAQTSAQQARRDAIAEQNSRLQASQFQAEFDQRNRLAAEQLQLQRDQEANRQREAGGGGEQYAYVDYGRVFNNQYQTPAQRLAAYGVTGDAALAQQNAEYARLAGVPGSNVYRVGRIR